MSVNSKMSNIAALVLAANADIETPAVLFDYPNGALVLLPHTTAALQQYASSRGFTSIAGLSSDQQIEAVAEYINLNPATGDQRFIYTWDQPQPCSRWNGDQARCLEQVGNYNGWTGCDWQPPYNCNGTSIGCAGMCDQNGIIHADTLVLESGDRCAGELCGDCEDAAILRMAMLRVLGLGWHCVWAVDHYDRDEPGGHTYNVVYYKSKWRIMDWHRNGDGTELRYVDNGDIGRSGLHDHADNLWNDYGGHYWCAPHSDTICLDNPPDNLAYNYWHGQACHKYLPNGTFNTESYMHTRLMPWGDVSCCP